MFPVMNESTLRTLYSIGLGVIIALFVGLGIATFYPAPVLADTSGLENYELREAARGVHEALMESYNRNVTIAALVSSLAILGLSVWTEARKPLFAGGLLLGGLLTLLYGLTRGLTSGVTAVAFFSVAFGLAVIVVLGHQRLFSARAVDARAKRRADQVAAYAVRMQAYNQQQAQAFHGGQPAPGQYPQPAQAPQVWAGQVPPPQQQ